MTSLSDNIYQAWISFPCPSCELENDCRIQQVGMGENVLCRGCHLTIRLVDNDVSTAQAKKQISNAIDDLVDAFNKIF